VPRDVDSPDDDNERTQSGPNGDSVPGDLPPRTVVYQKTQRWMWAGVFEILAEDVRSLLPSSLCFRMTARTPAPRIRAISASAPSAIALCHPILLFRNAVAHNSGEACPPQASMPTAPVGTALLTQHRRFYYCVSPVDAILQQPTAYVARLAFALLREGARRMREPVHRKLIREQFVRMVLA